ncbi:MAG: glycosyltransferase family 1 protein [Fibrobacteria bacterium]
MEKKKQLLLVEALAVRNDSGLGSMARLFVDALRGFSDFADIHVIVPRACPYRPPDNCHVIAVTAKPLRWWIQIVFPLLIMRMRPDAVFCLGQTLPNWRPASRYALAVPDAGPLEDLGWPTSSHDAYNRRWLKSMVPRADSIVAISAFTKARLASLLTLSPDKIKVVFPVRPTRWKENTDPRLPVAAFSPGKHPPGEYFLAIGNLEPRKNFPGLIAAYALLRKKRPDAPPLYIVGHLAWGASEAAEAIARHAMEDRIHLTGYLSDPDRRAYLEHCRCFISSSLYEGWGLPLYEALAARKASIYHAGSSQEEFAQGSALAVDCRNPASLAEAMERLWSDAEARRRLGEGLAAAFPAVEAYDLEDALRSVLAPLLLRA